MMIKFLFLSLRKIIVPGSNVASILAVVTGFWGALVIGTVTIEMFHW